jgi:hypothetical protein
VIGFFLGSGIVPSLSGLASKRRSLPEEEAMPVVSVLERLLYTTFAMASEKRPWKSAGVVVKPALCKRIVESQKIVPRLETDLRDA